MIVLFYFQFFSLSQLHTTRAISGHSVTIIAWVVAGAGAVIRLFGPECVGGIGDIGARIDAEVARTGLSADEIGSKVHILIYISLDGLINIVSKDIMPYRRKTCSNSWPSCNV